MGQAHQYGGKEECDDEYFEFFEMAIDYHGGLDKAAAYYDGIATDINGGDKTAMNDLRARISLLSRFEAEKKRLGKISGNKRWKWVVGGNKKTVNSSLS